MIPLNPKDRERITALTTHIVAGMIERKEVDPTNEEALRAATKRATADARTIYFAALDVLK